MRGMKLGNEYQLSLGHLYHKTPKSVFAAIAYSLAFAHEDESQEGAIKALLAEWHYLYDNQIIPQKPPTKKE